MLLKPFLHEIVLKALATLLVVIAVNGINVPQTSALKNSAVAFNIVGTVGQTEVVTPGKIYNVSFVVTNTAKQSVTRTLRIQVLPQNDGIRNPITAVTTSTFVN